MNLHELNPKRRYHGDLAIWDQNAYNNWWGGFDEDDEVYNPEGTLTQVWMENGILYGLYNADAFGEVVIHVLEEEIADLLVEGEIKDVHHRYWEIWDEHLLHPDWSPVVP